MRVIVLFAPGFLAFGKAFIKILQERNPAVEIIGLASTRKTYKALKKDKTCNFAFLDCLESREKEWLKMPYDQSLLKSYEDRLGAHAIGNILILDRLAGSGLVSCARPIETELTRAARKAGTLRAYMTGMLDYFDTLIEQQKPDAAFLYAIAGCGAGAILHLMQHKNLPVLKLQHTRIEDRYMVDTSMTGLLDPLWSRFFAGAVGSKSAQARAQAWIDEFRSQDKRPDYFVYNTQRLKKLFSPPAIAKNAVLALFRALYYCAFPGQKQLRAEDGFFRFRESLMVPFRSIRMTRESAYSDYEALRNSDFIYFPLHVDPEASTMQLAPDFTDQPAVIEMLAKRRPLHMNILVKEHPNMIGRRPPGFYERITRLPGVYLINPGVASPALIRQAKLVFTITGTAAWEAIVLGVPAAMLGHFPFLPFATGMGKGLKIAQIHTLADDIRAAMELPPVPDDELARLLALLFDESFSVSSQLFWGEVGDHVVAANIDMVRHMAEQFLKRYRDYDMLAHAA